MDWIKIIRLIIAVLIAIIGHETIDEVQARLGTPRRRAPKKDPPS